MKIIKSTKVNGLYYNEITKLLNSNLASSKDNIFIEGSFNEDGEYEKFICFIKSINDIRGGVVVQNNKIIDINLFNHDNFFKEEVFKDIKKYIGMYIDIPIDTYTDKEISIKLKCIKDFSISPYNNSDVSFSFKKGSIVNANVSDEGVCIEYRPNLYSSPILPSFIHKHFA